MRQTTRVFLVPLAVVTFFCQPSLTSLFAEVPPAPPGYTSENDVKAAFLSGKLKAIDLTIDVPDTVTAQKNIEYGKGGNKTLQLDLYSPKDRTHPLPAILFLHGGGWTGGYRQLYHYYCTEFAEHGYVVATASY